MDPKTQNPATTSTSTTPSTAAQPPPAPPKLSQPSPNQKIPSSSTSIASFQNPNPRPSIPQSAAQPHAARPPAFPQSTAQSQPRPGTAVGVPARHPAPSPRPVPLSSSFGGLGRGGVNVPPQGRQPMQAMQQGRGMVGSVGSNSSLRPAGIPAQHQQRPVQSSLRPPSSPSSQLPASSNLQGHGLLRASSVASSGSPSTNASPSVASSSHQPWLQSVPQGKPPLPSPSYRSPMNPQTLQQRPHMQPQHNPALQKSAVASSQQLRQPSLPPQRQELYGQKFPPPRVAQSLPTHQQIPRVQGSGNQSPLSLPMLQPGANQSGVHNMTKSVENDEYSNRILSKRSIHDLYSQMDPSGKLDSDVEEFFNDIADYFLESIITSGCLLAKHRKSNTLEAKDLLVPLERNWNITLPGFGGDEIKAYKKQPTNDVHKERVAAVKKSTMVTDTANSKNPTEQLTVEGKNNMSKAPASPVGT